MGKMVLDIVSRKLERGDGNIAFTGDHRFKVVKRPAFLTYLGQIQEFRGMS